MIIGFISLAAGVLLSTQLPLSYRAMYYALVAFGLIIYIVGRIGMYFTPKKEIKETETEEEPEVKTVEETEKNKIEI
jgi:phosphotransferase system  glucose/maltose/N-acetylglucosamine-specific IIC component